MSSRFTVRDGHRFLAGSLSTGLHCQAQGRLMFDLDPDLPDDTLIEMVRIPTRIRNAIQRAGLKTMGELRETTDETFASLPDLGPGSVKWLRARLSKTTWSVPSKR